MFDTELTATTLSRPTPTDHTLTPLSVLYTRLAVFRRHWRPAVAVLTATLALAVLQTRTSVSQYRATATLLIEDERENFAGLMNPAMDYYRDPELYAETQYSLLRSMTVAQHVAETLDLDGPIPDVTNPLAASTLRDRALSAVEARVTRAAGWLRGSPVTSVRATAEPSANPAVAREMWAAHIATSVLVQPETNTRLVHVAFAGPDPDLAASIVNALVAAYVDLSLELRQGNTTQTVDWIQEELATQKEMLARSDNALIEYRESQNALSLGENNDIITTRLAMLNEEVTAVERDRVASESIYLQVRDLDLDKSADLLEVPVIWQHPVVRELRALLATHEAERVRLADRYGPRHPEIQEIGIAIKTAEEELSREAPRVVASIEADYQAARHFEQELRRELANQQDRAAELKRKSASYDVLTREADSDRTVYEMLLQRGKELEILAHSNVNNIQIIRLAGPGVALHSRVWFGTSIFGVLLSVGLVFGINLLNDRIQRPEDLTRLFNLPVLGMVPKVQSKSNPSIDDVSLEHFEDAFRRLRTSVAFAARQSDEPDGSASRVLLVTSAQPGEGKTVTSCNLAMMLARGGAHVLLVDADLYRANVERHFRLKDRKGLSELLQGQISFRDALTRTDDPNLDLIVAGSPTDKPGELIAGAQMKALVAHLRQSSGGWVIIDSPPVMAVSDAVTLAPLATGVIVVVGEDMTRKGQVQRTLEQLKSVPCHIVGGVLNLFEPNRNKYDYRNYYDNRYEKADRKVA